MDIPFKKLILTSEIPLITRYHWYYCALRSYFRNVRFHFPKWLLLSDSKTMMEQFSKLLQLDFKVQNTWKIARYCWTSKWCVTTSWWRNHDWWYIIVIIFPRISEKKIVLHSISIHFSRTMFLTIFFGSIKILWYTLSVFPMKKFMSVVKHALRNALRRIRPMGWR